MSYLPDKQRERQQKRPHDYNDKRKTKQVVLLQTTKHFYTHLQK